MDNVPPLQAEGPDFVEQVRKADELARRLQENKWQFAKAPEFFARTADCDVAAKEIINIFDGKMQTRLGRLVMKGRGSRFNLMSHESPNATYIGDRRHIFSEVNAQVGSRGLEGFPEFEAMKPLQRGQLYNPTIFYQLRDVVFWNALYGVGLFPTGFEDVAKQLAAGNVIRNLIFDSNLASVKREEPVYVEAHAGIAFPTPVVEWMVKPLYGGMSKETIHIETLLTIEESSLSHPFLPVVATGTVLLNDRRYFMRRFAGIAPKDATRGPGVPPEGIRK
jgi:hypothetical protein